MDSLLEPLDVLYPNARVAGLSERIAVSGGSTVIAARLQSRFSELLKRQGHLGADKAIVEAKHIEVMLYENNVDCVRYAGRLRSEDHGVMQS